MTAKHYRLAHWLNAYGEPFNARLSFLLGESNDAVVLALVLAMETP